MTTIRTLRYPLSAVGASAGLATALIILFVICALAQVLFPGVQVAHSWIALFTVAPLDTARAWIEGILASIFFGWVAASVFVLTYNAVSGRE